MSIVHATDASFAAEVEQQKGTVLVDFWAPWCGPCKMLSPVLDEIANEEAGNLKVVKVNVDENQQTPGNFSVLGIPALILFKDGAVVKQVTGYRSKEQLKAWINSPN
jgi:thioredoxin 1